ncbi:MAG: 2-phospho-L-lactate guanylyltransferase [Gaiellales bacterium]
MLIPVKRLDDAKRRLAPVLGPAERRSLMQSMIEHVAAVALEAGVGRVALASSDPVVVERAGRLGVGAVSDGGLPWNDGLELARSELRPQPAAVLYLAGDLPLLTAAEVRRLADEAQAGTVVVGRAGDAGTNALAVSPAAALAPRFGEPRSSQVHARAAERAGLRVVMLDLPGVALDVDTPDDLARAGLAG